MQQEEDWWRKVLAGTHSRLRWGRRVFVRLPTYPRCKLCSAPFEGAGALLMQLVGRRLWRRNPKYCGACFKIMERRRGGVEIECTLLFADVRGSVELAEGRHPTEFRALIDRFYNSAVRVLVEHDAIVDKLVGDEIIGIFVPGLAGQRHATRAIESARALLAATGHNSTSPWIPIGIGVHTGSAFVGTVGEAPHLEFTALGDTVNTCARLASSAGKGEVLASAVTARAANLNTGLEQRALSLKGKGAKTEVVVLRSTSQSSPLT
ncbi:MAG: adenylate/guanylate cyclase domain-containing protein [Actinomycetota bacterium]